MSSAQKNDKVVDMDVEMAVTGSVVKKSGANETSGKSDGHDTSGTSVEKKPSKKKKIKTSSPSSSHKKVKKDPNKPEYPKVGKNN